MQRTLQIPLQKSKKEINDTNFSGSISGAMSGMLSFVIATRRGGLSLC